MSQNKITMLDLSNRIARSSTISIATYTLLLSVFLSFILGFMYVRLKTNAIIDSAKPSLSYLMDRSNFVQITRQLNFIVQNGSILAYQIKDKKSEDPLVTNGVWENTPLPEDYSPTFYNGNFAWIHRYKLQSKNTGSNLELFVIHPVSYHPFLFGLLASLLFLTVILLIVRKLMTDYSVTINRHFFEFITVLRRLQGSHSGNLDNFKYETKFKEVQEIVDRFVMASKEALESKKMEEKYKAKEELADAVRKVSHDISSPMGSLKSVVFDYKNIMDEKVRSALRKNIVRIEDIVNILKFKNKEIDNDFCYLDLTINGILSEKRNDLGDNAEIDFDRKGSSYGLFAKIRTHTLSSIISNIINNAVEAGAKNIKVSCSETKDCVSILVKDDGGGIPDSIKDKVFAKEFSYGKGSMGLGLYSAKEELEEAGGRIGFDSVEGEGSLFSLFIPKADRPAWHVPHIEISPDQVAVVIDDENFIHRVWKNRLSNKVLSLKTYKAFKLWLTQQDDLKDYLFLVDFEFVGQGVNGIDIIKEIESPNVILVTSRADDYKVIELCERNAIKLLPKELVEHTLVMEVGG